MTASLSWPGLEVRDPACQDHPAHPVGSSHTGLWQVEVLKDSSRAISSPRSRLPVNPKPIAKSSASLSMTATLRFLEVDTTFLTGEEVRPGGGQSRLCPGPVRPREAGRGQNVNLCDLRGLGCDAESGDVQLWGFFFFFSFSFLSEFNTQPKGCEK